MRSAVLVAIVAVAAAEAQSVCVCTAQYAPVVCADGKQYSNQCTAKCQGYNDCTAGTVGGSNTYEKSGGGSWFDVVSDWSKQHYPVYPETAVVANAAVITEDAGSVARTLLVTSNLVIRDDSGEGVTVHIGPHTCGANQVVVSSATADANTQCACSSSTEHLVDQGRSCAPNQCKCDNGDPVASSQCAQHDQYHCDAAQCDATYHPVAKGAVTECSENVCQCDNGEEVNHADCHTHDAHHCKSDQCAQYYHPETISEEGKPDRVECKRNQCSCEHGQIATDCNVHSQEQCQGSTEDCDEGYHMDSETSICTENECTCEFGVEAPGISVNGSGGPYCTTHEAEECISCQATYNDDAGTGVCVGNECTCANGDAVDRQHCFTNGQELCKSCDATWHCATSHVTGACAATGDQCNRNECACVNGQPVHADNCEVHHLKSGVEVCDATQCNAAHHHNDVTGACDQNVCTCTFGDEAEGVDCVKNDAQICYASTCQTGYHPEDDPVTGYKVCVINECYCTRGQERGPGNHGTHGLCDTHGKHTCAGASACDKADDGVTQANYYDQATTICEPLRTCLNADGKYEKHAPTPTDNRVCGTVEDCDNVLEYEHAPENPTSDKDCRERKHCLLNEWQDWSECTASCLQPGQAAPTMTRIRTIDQHSHQSAYTHEGVTYDKTCNVTAFDTHTSETRQCNAFCCKGSEQEDSDAAAASVVTLHADHVGDTSQTIELVEYIGADSSIDKDALCAARTGMHKCTYDESNQQPAEWKSMATSSMRFLCCGVRTQPVCKSCDAGSSSDYLGLGQCQTCDYGHWAAGGSNTCKACDAGKHLDSTGGVAAGDCKDCGVGTYAESGAQDCTACGDGYVSGENTEKQDDCEVCLAGHFSKSLSDTCEECDYGEYQNEQAQPGCKDCPAGTYTGSVKASTTESTDCKTCSTGLWSPEGEAECTACDAGRYSGSPRQGPWDHEVTGGDCNACPAGEWSDDEAASCEPCPTGEWQDSTGRPSCKPCPAGKFNTGTGADGVDHCEECPVGHWCAEGAKQVEPCGPGYWQPNPEATEVGDCRECPAGKHSAGAVQDCEKCGAGTYQNQPTQDHCEDCPEGTAQPFEEKKLLADCELCHLGKYQPHKARSYCLSCGNGQFQNQRGEQGCKDCPAGRFGKPYTETYYKAAGGENCGTSPGSHTLIHNTQECEAAAEKLGLTYHAESVETASRTAGCFYAADGARFNFNLDGHGTNNNEGGICMQARKLHRDSDDDGCKDCPVGKYQEIDGKRGCSECNEGKASAETGANSAVVCVACEAGEYAVGPANSVCTKCGLGKFGDDAKGKNGDGHFNSETHCIKCDHGWFQEADGKTDCEECEAGTYTGVPTCNEDNSSCTFEAKKGHSECVACPLVGGNPNEKRKWISDAGSTFCTKKPMDAVVSEWSSWTSTVDGQSHPDMVNIANTCSKECQDEGGYDGDNDNGTPTWVPRTDPGRQSRTRIAENQTPCSLADQSKCNWSWGFDGATSDKKNFGPDTNKLLYGERDCNTGGTVTVDGTTVTNRFCARNCSLNAYEPWSTCTASCGDTGTTFRTRTKMHEEVHGGLCDRTMREDANCNRVSCLAPVCHNEHVQCKVEQKNFGSGCAGQLFGCAPTAIGGGDTKPKCFEWANHKLNCHFDDTAATEALGHIPHDEKAHRDDRDPNKCDGSDGPKTCHKCSTQEECAISGTHSTIVVTHDRKNMCRRYGAECTRGPDGDGNDAAYESDFYNAYQESQLQDVFQCERHCMEDGALRPYRQIIQHTHTNLYRPEDDVSKPECQHCQCRCKKHPPCAGQQGKALTNEIILGNHWEGIAQRQDCCNMCTNHPQCGSFTHTADGDCMLYFGAPAYKAAGEDSTFSGATFGDDA